MQQAAVRIGQAVKNYNQRAAGIMESALAHSGKPMKVLFLATVFLGCNIFLPELFYDGFETPKLFIFQMGLCVLMVAAAIKYRGDIKLPAESLLLMGLSLVACASVFWGYNKGLAFERLTHVCSLAACLLCAYWLKSRRLLYWIAAIGIWIATWGCLLDLIEPLRLWVYPHFFETWPGGEIIDRYRPVTSNQGNPNFTLHVLVLTLPLTVGLTLSDKKRAVFWWIGVFIQAVCFFLSQNRSGLFAVAVALLIMFWRQRKVFLLAGACIAALFFASDNWRARFKTIFSLQSIDVYSRLVFLETGWAMFKDDPVLGKGIGQFVLYYPKYKTAEHWDKFKLVEPEITKPMQIPKQAHNEYLQVLIETGAVGLVFFIGFFGVLLWRCKRWLKAHRDPVILGAFAGVIGVLVNALFTFPLQTVASACLFWTTCGVLLLIVGYKINLGQIMAFDRWLLVVCAANMFWTSARIIQAEYLFFDGIKNHAKNLPYAFEVNKWAADILPYRFEMQFVAGWIAHLNYSGMAYEYFLKAFKAAPYFPATQKYLPPDTWRKDDRTTGTLEAEDKR